MTLGKLKDEAKNKKILSGEKCNELKEVNNFRNAIVHKIFQENIITNKLTSAEKVQEINEKSLTPMINKTDLLNKFIIEQIRKYTEKLHEYKKQVGIEINL